MSQIYNMRRSRLRQNGLSISDQVLGKRGPGRGSEKKVRTRESESVGPKLCKAIVRRYEDDDSQSKIGSLSRGAHNCESKRCSRGAVAVAVGWW